MKNMAYAVITLLFILCLLTGCVMTQTPESTPPTTVETIAPSTEPAVSVMDAESLYWKMRYATGSKGANQYTTVQNLSMRVGSAGVFLRSDMTSTTRACRSLDPFAVNVETEMYYSSMDLEVEQKVNMYYRLEDTELVCYLYVDALDIWERQVVGGSAYDLFQMYTTKGYPSNLPKGLTISDEIQMLGDKEAYVLSYNMSGEEYFGIFGDEEIDAQISNIQIPVTTYVDAETYLPLQIEVTMHELGELLSKLIYSSMGGMVVSDVGEVVIEINDYTLITKDMNFEIVEVPDIPDAGLKKDKQSAGFMTV